jgi:hypothetical protein
MPASVNQQAEIFHLTIDRYGTKAFTQTWLPHLQEAGDGN